MNRFYMAPVLLTIVVDVKFSLQISSTTIYGGGRCEKRLPLSTVVVDVKIAPHIASWRTVETFHVRLGW